MTNSTFSGIVEQALGDDLGDVDVEAGEIAGLVAEMPGRVGAAGADDQLAARQHVGELVGVGGTAETGSRDGCATVLQITSSARLFMTPSR